MSCIAFYLLVTGALLAGEVSAQRASQPNAPWGLARTSERYTWSSNGPRTYKWFTGQSKKVTVYVVDTGITPHHTDFEGRARLGASFVSGEPECDMNGHGTHVAGTVAGKEYGICKRCDVVGVKALGRRGSGSMYGIMQAIDWATQDCKDGSACVMNLSLGGGRNSMIDSAVKRATDKGIFVAVAAGNERQDACNVSPARAESVYCVAASDERDTFARFSNYGRCVEVIAPGVNIKSAWVPSDPDSSCQSRSPVSDSRSIQGTSMASPHIAGLGAYLRLIGHGGRTAKETSDAVTALVMKNKISNVPSGTPNLLGFNGYWED